jgi:hypothetical protein
VIDLASSMGQFEISYRFIRMRAIFVVCLFSCLNANNQIVCLSLSISLSDPKRLASTAVDLNLKLMRFVLLAFRFVCLDCLLFVVFV